MALLLSEENLCSYTTKTQRRAEEAAQAINELKDQVEKLRYSNTKLNEAIGEYQLVERQLSDAQVRLDEERKEKDGVKLELVRATAQHVEREKVWEKERASASLVDVEREKELKAVKDKLDGAQSTLASETAQRTELKGQIHKDKVALEAAKRDAQESARKCQDLNRKLAESQAAVRRGQEDSVRRGERETQLQKQIDALEAGRKNDAAAVEGLPDRHALGTLVSDMRLSFEACSYTSHTCRIPRRKTLWHDWSRARRLAYRHCKVAKTAS